MKYSFLAPRQRTAFWRVMCYLGFISRADHHEPDDNRWSCTARPKRPSIPTQPHLCNSGTALPMMLAGADRRYALPAGTADRWRFAGRDCLAILRSLACLAICVCRAMITTRFYAAALLGNLDC